MQRRDFITGLGGAVATRPLQRAALPLASRQGMWLELVTIAFACCVLTGYVAVRAATLSITHDEALTYLWHVTGKLEDIYLLKTPGLPDNNHVLFTILAKFAISKLGNSELALRLPSVVGYAVFCAALAAILRRQLHGVWLIVFLLFVALNPYIVDFMSIARGYGLGLGLSMAGTWCLLKGSEPGRPLIAWWGGWSTFFFALATLANLTFLLVYVAALSVGVFLLVARYWRDEISLRGAALAAILPTLLTAALVPFLARQVLLLRRSGLLTTEGATSFYVDSVRALLNASFYFSTPSDAVTLLLVALAYGLPITGLIIGSFRLRRLDGQDIHRSDGDLFVFSVLLVGGAVLSVLQHRLAGTAYLSARRAIFLVPLYGLVCASLFSILWNMQATWSRAIALALSALPIGMVGHFGMSVNLRTTRDWVFDSQTKDMMSELETLLPPTGPRRYQLGANWWFQPSINYYLVRNSWRSVGQFDFRGSAGEQELYRGRRDAYYVSDQFLPEVKSAAGALIIVKHFDPANATLLVSALLPPGQGSSAGGP
jgi:hypothetical protein